MLNHSYAYFRSLFPKKSTKASICSRRRAFLAAGAFSICWAAAGCNRQPAVAFDNLDITGNRAFGTDFAVPDTNGRLRTLADFRGKVVVMLFGYTHCPDICPTTMAELAQAVQQLGGDAKRVQVLFVTVDPQRDTPSLLAQYVTAFNPSFIGLRPANDAQLAKLTADFHIYQEKTAAASGDRYLIAHTPSSYVFDRNGRLRLLVRYGEGSTVWEHDLKLLLS